VSNPRSELPARPAPVSRSVSRPGRRGTADFNKAKFASLAAFLEYVDPFLAAWPADVPVAAEVRNKVWMTAALGDCLRRHNAVWVLPDQAWMPSPLSVVERLDAVTGPFAYIRLLGDRAAVDALTPTLDHIVIDRTGQVAEDARTGRRVREQPLRGVRPGDGAATRGTDDVSGTI